MEFKTKVHEKAKHLRSGRSKKNGLNIAIDPNGSYDAETHTISTEITRSRWKECQHTIVNGGGGPYPLDADDNAFCFTYGWPSRQALESGDAPEYTKKHYSRYHYKSAMEVLGYTNQQLESAMADAYTKLKLLFETRSVSEFNPMRACLELRDTTSTLNGLVSFARFCRQKVATGRLRLATTIGAAASAYLTYRFGVKPTIDDTATFRKELASGELTTEGNPKASLVQGQILRSDYRVGVSPRVQRSMCPIWVASATYRNGFTVKGNRGRTASWHPLMYGDLVPPTGYNSYRVQTSKGRFFAELVDDVIYTEGQDLIRRFQYKSPITETAWQLARLSFLFDWVYDVSGALRTLERGVVSAFTSRYLGQVWHSHTVESYDWIPYVRSSCVGSPAGFRLSSDGKIEAGYIDLDCTTTLDYRRTNLNRLYTRKPYGGLTRPPQRMREEVKAYQLSTGMALLASWASPKH